MSAPAIDFRVSNSHPASSKFHLNNPLVFAYQHDIEKKYGIQVWRAVDRFGLAYYVHRVPERLGFSLVVSDPHGAISSDPGARILLELNHRGYVSRESEQQRLLQELAEWVALHYFDKGEMPSDLSGVIR